MKTMPVTEFKSKALKVLSDLAREREPIIITKRGKPLAEVVPYTESGQSAGQLAETLVYEKDVLTPLGAEMWSAGK